MKLNARKKGANGEREAAALFLEYLGIKLKRNLEQSREGGHDLQMEDDKLGFAIEVKREERLRVEDWWEQALTQAKAAGLKPALMYRQSRHPWRFVMRLGDVNPDYDFQGDYATVEMGLTEFFTIVRQSMAEKAEEETDVLWLSDTQGIFYRTVMAYLEVFQERCKGELKAIYDEEVFRLALKKKLDDLSPLLL